MGPFDGDGQKLPASMSQTDRELLLSIHQTLCSDGGVCDMVQDHSSRISKLETRWVYLVGGYGALMLGLVIMGRLKDFGIL